jgi:hypothetical protein
MTHLQQARIQDKNIEVIKATNQIKLQNTRKTYKHETLYLGISNHQK